MVTTSEVRNDFTDDQNYTHIDYWETDSDNEEGKTVAIVCRDTKKVYFIYNQYRFNQEVSLAINEILKEITN